MVAKWTWFLFSPSAKLVMMLNVDGRFCIKVDELQIICGFSLASYSQCHTILSRCAIYLVKGNALH